MIHYVCVATESKGYFPYLKQLIPNLDVLGFDKKWTGFSMKFELMIEYLNSLHDDDIVCFIDAYDVLPTKNIVNLEKKFTLFSKKHPEIKMVIGYGKNNNILFETCIKNYFGTIDGDRINSGTYIGYVKNVKDILLSIYRSQTDEILDDQIEFTKYIKQKGGVFIDKKCNFFNVISKPLLQIKNTNKKCCFIHAPANGLLDDFLLEHHNIRVNLIDRMHNFTDNFNCASKKLIITYPKIYISKIKSKIKI